MGSLEFACAAAGAKVVLVMGHTACGAIPRRHRQRAAQRPNQACSTPIQAGHRDRPTRASEAARTRPSSTRWRGPTCSRTIDHAAQRQPDPRGPRGERANPRSRQVDVRPIERPRDLPGLKEAAPASTPPSFSSRPHHEDHLFSRIATLAIALVLTACAAPRPQRIDEVIRRGKIEQITPTTIRSEAHATRRRAPAASAGVGLGSLISGSTRRDVAMVAGAIRGTMAGKDRQPRGPVDARPGEVFVRTDSGVLVEVTADRHDLRVGQRVFLQGSGHQTRVIPR